MSKKVIQLVVVDDHVLFRRGLISLLDDMTEFKVVGEAGNGKEALEVISNSHPDVVLMDVNMPVMDGIAAVEALRASHSPVSIMMLTISQNDSDLLGAIRAGADGYLLKNAEPEELKQGILRLAGGQGVLSPEVTGTLLKTIVHNSGMSEQPLLSDRELQVLRCMSEGQTTQQISVELFISGNTVKTHVRHILEKFGASNRTEAVSKAIQLGILTRNLR
jgi:DNA-binding NarL/FixJ family response regulator